MPVLAAAPAIIPAIIPPSATASFGLVDWLVLAAYLAIVVTIGLVVSRRRPSGAEFFLAGRTMPMWAVAVSVLATSLSAATFIGGPQQAYTSDLTYLSASFGGLLAVILVATIFIPAYYRAGVTSVYELLGEALGTPARVASSGMFMIGRVFASGARLFMVALPFALIAFGDTTPASMTASIVLLTAAAAAYTLTGGIRAVIWTDVLQAIVVVGTVVIAFVILLDRIPAGAGEIVQTLRADGDAGKLRILDFSLDPSRPFTVWTALIGFTLFNLAAFGTDQDLTQRMLTCRSARSGAWAVILSNLLGWPVVFLFLALGVLLFVYYQRPDLVSNPGYSPDDTRKVFLEFMLRDMPTGLRGLMMAGLFAAGMSSLDSALNALASTTVADFYRPWRARRRGSTTGAAVDRREIIVSRVSVGGWAAALALFAIGCVWWQRSSGDTLIAFALGVMVFAYAGLLGVFLTAILTRRGNATSAVAALAAGFVTVVLLRLVGGIAFPWQMTVATAVSFAVCLSGKRVSVPFS